jgi:hypothetical protein
MAAIQMTALSVAVHDAQLEGSGEVSNLEVIQTSLKKRVNPIATKSPADPRTIDWWVMALKATSARP